MQILIRFNLFNATQKIFELHSAEIAKTVISSHQSFTMKLVAVFLCLLGYVMTSGQTKPNVKLY